MSTQLTNEHLKALKMFPEKAVQDDVIDLCNAVFQLRLIAKEQHEALIDCVSAAEAGAFRVSVQAEATRLIAKYEAMTK